MKRNAENLKRKLGIGILSLVLSSLFVITGCQTKENTSTISTNSTGSNKVTTTSETALESLKIKVGVCAGPYGDMVKEAIAPALKEKGYEVEVVEFSDYVVPNIALSDNEIQVNLFQHQVYLDKFIADRGLKIVSIAKVPTAGMGIFSEKMTSLETIKDKAKVAIPNDAANLSRAIKVLAQAGLVVIDPTVDPSSISQFTLSENPYHLEFVEIEAPQLPRSLDSVDLAVITGNFAISAGLDLTKAVYNEKVAEDYLNVIAVREEDRDSALAKDIISVVQSEAFKKVIESSDYQYTTFTKPENY